MVEHFFAAVEKEFVDTNNVSDILANNSRFPGYFLPGNWQLSQAKSKAFLSTGCICPTKGSLSLFPPENRIGHRIPTLHLAAQWKAWRFMACIDFIDGRVRQIFKRPPSRAIKTNWIASEKLSKNFKLHIDGDLSWTFIPAPSALCQLQLPTDGRP